MNRKGLLFAGPKVCTRVLSENRCNWFEPDVVACRSRQRVEPTAAHLANDGATTRDIAEIEALPTPA